MFAIIRHTAILLHSRPSFSHITWQAQFQPHYMAGPISATLHHRPWVSATLQARPGYGLPIRFVCYDRKQRNKTILGGNLLCRTDHKGVSHCCCLLGCVLGNEKRLQCLQSDLHFCPSWKYQWAARKRWATAPSTQSSTIESSIVHVSIIARSHHLPLYAAGRLDCVDGAAICKEWMENAGYESPIVPQRPV